jgi:hypothetical protein
VKPSVGRKENIQTAPYPHELADLVGKCSYRAHEGWVVSLVDDAQRDKDADGKVIGHGLTLSVLTNGYDSYNPDKGPTYRVYHYFIVPAATYNRASWQRWLFDQLCRVELHEAMEHFIIDGERPLAPTHGPGDDPNVVHEYATDMQRRTKYTGEVLST